MITKNPFKKDLIILLNKYASYIYDTSSDDPEEIYILYSDTEKWLDEQNNNYKTAVSPGKRETRTNMAKVDKVIKLRVDVTKLNKDWFFHGKKGVYADMTLLFREEQDDYESNGMIVQDVPSDIYKEEKDLPQAERTKGAILGNAKVWATQGERDSESVPGGKSKTKSSSSRSRADDDEDEQEEEQPRRKSGAGGRSTKSAKPVKRSGRRDDDDDDEPNDLPF